jgi:flagellar biosynthesis component FlhA
MTQWLIILYNPVVYFFLVISFLITLYAQFETASVGVLWTLLITCSFLALGLFIAINMVNQFKQKMLEGPDGRLYQVFEEDEAIVLTLGQHLTALNEHPGHLIAKLDSVRHYLAEQYGFVVPPIQVAHDKAATHPQAVVVTHRRLLLGQCDLYNDALAVPVPNHSHVSGPAALMTDTAENTQYVWTPKDEVTLHDKAVAKTATDFMLLRLQDMLLDNALHLITRSSVQKLMLIIRQQDPHVFYELFELNQLSPQAFRQLLADRLKQRQSIRSLVQVCDDILRAELGIPQQLVNTRARLNG